jgi:hypothetical protein
MSASQDAAQTLGEVDRAFYAAINARTNPDQLVELNTKLWRKARSRGWVNDEEATYLADCIANAGVLLGHECNRLARKTWAGWPAHFNAGFRLANRNARPIARPPEIGAVCWAARAACHLKCASSTLRASGP